MYSGKQYSVYVDKVCFAVYFGKQYSVYIDKVCFTVFSGKQYSVYVDKVCSLCSFLKAQSKDLSVTEVDNVTLLDRSLRIPSSFNGLTGGAPFKLRTEQLIRCLNQSRPFFPHTLGSRTDGPWVMMILCIRFSHQPSAIAQVEVKSYG